MRCCHCKTDRGPPYFRMSLRNDQICSVTNMLTLMSSSCTDELMTSVFLALFHSKHVQNSTWSSFHYAKPCSNFGNPDGTSSLPIHLCRNRTTKQRQFVYARRWYKSSPLPHRTNRTKGAAGKDGTKAFRCHVEDLERCGKTWERPFCLRHLQILPSPFSSWLLNFGLHQERDAYHRELEELKLKVSTWHLGPVGGNGRSWVAWGMDFTEELHLVRLTFFAHENFMEPEGHTGK